MSTSPLHQEVEDVEEAIQKVTPKVAGGMERTLG
jgi:hypothetical protein